MNGGSEGRSGQGDGLDDTATDTDTDTPVTGPDPRRRRRLLVLSVIAVGAVIAAVVLLVVRLTAEPDDVAIDGALGERVTYGLPQWPVRGSLAEDAQFQRDAVAQVRRGDGADGNIALIWAGSGRSGSEESVDAAVFARPVPDSPVRAMDLEVVRRYEDGDWDTLVGEGRTVVSGGNPVWPLPVDDVEGFDGDASAHYLLAGDVDPGRVTTASGEELRVVDGVVGVEEDLARQAGGSDLLVFALRVDGDAVFSAVPLSRPLGEDSWTAERAETVVAALAETSGATDADDLLRELSDPREVRFDEGLAVVVPLQDHGVREGVGDEATRVGREQSAVILPPQGEPILSETASPAVLAEDVEVFEQYAVAVPDGLPGGPAIVLTGGVQRDETTEVWTVRTEPDIPVIGRPESGAAAVLGPAPGATAVTWLSSPDSDQEGPTMTTIVTTPSVE